jgi:hypothetical protein
VRRLDEAHGRQVAGLLHALERLGERALALGTEALGHRFGDAALLLAVLQPNEADTSSLRVLAASEMAKRVVVELGAAADRLRHASTQSAVEPAGDAVRLLDH